nr:putative ribonuclease H-like domain-containing protein [Tanacetum cinerariifolium]
MIGNVSYLSDFEAINVGYVAFGGNPKGGKITGKGIIKTGKLDFDDVYFVKELKFNLFSVSQMCDKKNSVLFTDTECIVLSSDFKLPDESHVLLRVPKENNMYSVDLKNIAINLSLWSSGFKDPRKGNVQQYVLFPLWSFGSKDPRNTDDDATFEVKEPEFKVKQPESKVYVSPSSSAKTKKHDDKTKREAKGNSHVELSIGVRKLTEEFEDCLITALTSVAAPSNTAVSQTLEKSSYVDPSQYPNDLYMPALEDITYSAEEADVGAEADFSNLETNITISPILTTRVYKDHHVSQIISDLSSAPLTRSMKRMVKD